MADRTPQDAMLGTATGLTGKEIMLLSRNPATVDSITFDNLFGPNSDQVAAGNHTHLLATTTLAGFLSSADKAKLDTYEQTKLVAAGGTTGQVLTKSSDTNFHFAWATPTGGTGGTNTGWVQYNTGAALTSVNPVMSTGQSGYETDTKRWKVGITGVAWNSLPYQDQPQTPGIITNPGTTIGFSFRPLATQLINYTTAPGGTVTMNVPSSAPIVGHEGMMFVKITNNSAGAITIIIPAYNVIGGTFDGSLAPTEALEFTIWTLFGIWYAEGASDLAPGSVGNSYLTNMATGTFKGRISAGTGSPEDVTAQQLRGQVDFVAPLSVALSGATTLTRTAHQGKLLVCSQALSITVATTTDFDQYTSCVIVAHGGAVTIIAGATVNTASTLVIPQNAIGILQRMTAADVYTLAWMGRPTDMAKISTEAGNEFNGNIWAGPSGLAGTDPGTLYFLR